MADWAVDLDRRNRMQSIVHVALVVRDYDEAIEFYTQKLRFALVEDTFQPEQNKRWVVVPPPGGGPPCFWPGRPGRSRSNAWGTNREAGCSCFWEPMIFSGITRLCGRPACPLSGRPRRPNTVRWRFFRIYMEIYGIWSSSGRATPWQNELRRSVAR